MKKVEYETLAIHTDSGAVEVQAVFSRSRALAAHKTTWVFDDGLPDALKKEFECQWTITHVATGYCASRGYTSRASAVRAMGRLDALDWRFRSTKSRKLKKLERDVLRLR